MKVEGLKEGDGLKGTLSDFARLRGVSAEAVSKAVRVGRLSRCIGRDSHGRPFITDMSIANEEWELNTCGQRRAEQASAAAAVALDRVSIFDIAGLVVIAIASRAGDFDEAQAFTFTPETAGRIALRLAGCVLSEFPTSAGATALRGVS